MFDMDSEESKLLSKNEKIAFIIAFFLLDIEGKHNPKAFEKV